MPDTPQEFSAPSVATRLFLVNITDIPGYSGGGRQLRSRHRF